MKISSRTTLKTSQPLWFEYVRCIHKNIILTFFIYFYDILKYLFASSTTGPGLTRLWRWISILISTTLFLCCWSRLRFGWLSSSSPSSLCCLIFFLLYYWEHGCRMRLTDVRYVFSFINNLDSDMIICLYVN